MNRIFFSPAMNWERMRVARKLKNKAPGKILNAFSGNGAYSLVIEKHVPGWEHFCVDVNIHALKLFRKGIMLNKLTSVYHLLSTDSTRIDYFLRVSKQKFDAVLLPLPLLSSIVLRKTRDHVNDEGIVFHQITWKSFEKTRNVPLEVKDELESSLEGLGFVIDEIRIIRSLAPRRYHLALDLIKTR